MKYEIEISTRFKKDYKLALKRGCNPQLLEEIVNMLANDEELPEKYQDHGLDGKFNGYRECHIQPDWLLIYRIDKKLLVLGLIRTGTHSDLF